ncbi:putative transferase CAF17, mitochondrial [Smittium culicis]|uniref:Putative transferase CAF17, mitochondrial n=1 Tax=Smittium culicis TaxID=133412 RepID=A0A1R1XRK9_9FUNG|nr:putative transferase CAF17, mitochondrial [Smittium culicis]
MILNATTSPALRAYLSINRLRAKSIRTLLISCSEENSQSKTIHFLKRNSIVHTSASPYSTSSGLSRGKETSSFNSTPFEDVLIKENLSSKFVNRYAKLDKRGLIQVSGEDAELLLQGLTTNQMSLISCGGSGIQTAFLLSNGRVLADAFVYPVNKPSSFSHTHYLIEIDDRIKDQVLRLLTMHKLRSKVLIKDVSNDYTIYSIWGNSIYTKILGKPDTTMSQNLPKGTLVYKFNEIMGADIWLKDNRCPSMGLRVILNSSQKRKYYPIFKSFHSHWIYQTVLYT